MTQFVNRLLFPLVVCLKIRHHHLFWVFLASFFSHFITHTWSVKIHWFFYLRNFSKWNVFFRQTYFRWWLPIYHILWPSLLLYCSLKLKKKHWIEINVHFYFWTRILIFKKFLCGIYKLCRTQWLFTLKERQRNGVSIRKCCFVIVNLEFMCHYSVRFVLSSASIGHSRILSHVPLSKHSVCLDIFKAKNDG